MTVYDLRADIRYREIDDGQYEDRDWLVGKFLGASMASSWGAVPAQFMKDRVSLKKPAGDFPYWTRCQPAFNRRAVEALRDILKANGEILPFSSTDGEFFAYNVLTIIDALDPTRSEMDFYDDGSVMSIDLPVFFPEKLVGATIFKIPQKLRVDVYVTDLFVQRVKDSDLKGFDFRPLWSNTENSG